MKVSKLQKNITEEKNLTPENSHLPKVSAYDVENLLRNIDRNPQVKIRFHQN